MYLPIDAMVTSQVLSACKVWEVKVRVQVSRRKFHTHTHTYIYIYILKANIYSKKRGTRNYLFNMLGLILSTLT